MKKYEIYTDTFEFRFGRSLDEIPAMSGQEILDTYLSMDTRITSNFLAPRMEEQHDTLEAAMAAWTQYATYGRTFSERGSVLCLLRGDLAYLQEMEYDEDGELLYGGDIIAFSCEDYSPGQ